jgi:hypothetical protein
MAFNSFTYTIVQDTDQIVIPEEPSHTVINEIMDLERRIVFMEKQIQQLKHRIAELELRGV